MEKAGRYIVVVCLALLITATIVTISAIPVHHDIGWPLWVAQRVLAGDALYVDVVEVHPPLIVGVSMAAVLLGRLPFLTSILAYHLLALSAALIALACCWRLLRVMSPAVSALVRQHVLLLLAFLLLPFVGYSFGQEEHLMLTLILPYLFAVGLLAARHELPRRDRVVMGLLAGLGFSMKPFYGPVWVALVLWLVWKRGRHALQRAEVIAPAAVMSAYIALTAVFARGYFDVAGWAADVYFDYFPTPLRFVVFSLGMAAALGALLIDRAMRTRGPFDSLRRVLLIVLFGSVAVVLVQQKGWSYHWYPVYASAILLADFSILDAVLEQNARLVRVLRPAVAGVSAALLLLVLGSWRLGWSKTFWGDLAGSPYHLPQMRNVVNRFAEGGPIVALSTGMPVGFPLVNYAGVAWASRFSCLWMLPGIYADVTSSGAPFPYHDAASASEIERYLIDAVTEDLRRGDPSLIIVDQAPPSPRMPGFGYIEYFSRDERFREIFGRYALIGTVGRYQIFKRVARST